MSTILISALPDWRCIKYSERGFMDTVTLETNLPGSLKEIHESLVENNLDPQAAANNLDVEDDEGIAKTPILTAITGTNADLIPRILTMYVPDGSTIADVTFGKGVFWRKVDVTNFNFLKSDLLDGVDFRRLPYADSSIDVLVLDPPYAHCGKSMLSGLNSSYQNQNNTSHESIVRLYAGGLVEAARVVKSKGLVIVKTQDETESGKQRFSHIEIIQLLELFGFAVIDLFVLMQTGLPIMREKYQKSARKNHSYALVARFRR
jgi:hypothetical protein